MDDVVAETIPQEVIDKAVDAVSVKLDEKETRDVIKTQSWKWWFAAACSEKRSRRNRRPEAKRIHT